MSALTSLPGWKALSEHLPTAHAVQMRDLFAADPQRFERFSLKLDDFLFDFSKNRITEETFGLLIELARQAGVEDWRDRMFSGEHINVTENRAVLHVALRNRA
ncbi:MAG TPA: glucose-6-phosphate isomerase, partial [Patescibacteria group bacterium]|nr:glucose-6-phosphate isomerase [Patescibacteria group bacterium]